MGGERNGSTQASGKSTFNSICTSGGHVHTLLAQMECVHRHLLTFHAIGDVCTQPSSEQLKRWAAIQGWGTPEV